MVILVPGEGEIYCKCRQQISTHHRCLSTTYSSVTGDIYPAHRGWALFDVWEGWGGCSAAIAAASVHVLGTSDVEVR